jgi:hypothetical protein
MSTPPAAKLGVYYVNFLEIQKHRSMTCTHNWQPLYTKPTARSFLEIWDSLNLSSWQQCDACQQLGRIQASGKVRLEPAKSRDRRLADVQKWNDTIRVYRQNLERL